MKVLINAIDSERMHKGKSLLNSINDYIVIDLETTGLDPKFDEIIEIGAIKVINNKIQDSFSTLIHPNRDISDFITNLTGITNDMLINAPSIKEVLPSFIEFIGNHILVGHNVNFDINFLYDNILYNLDEPLVNDFIDIMRFSRRFFKEYDNHKLCTLVNNFGIKTFPKHRALIDCYSTQLCYEYIKQYIVDNNIDISIVFKHTKLKASDVSATVNEFDESHPLYGKICAFTGVLSVPRKEAMQYVCNVGGICADSVTNDTNFLILGNNDYCSTIIEGKSSKQKKAESYILKGNDLTILSENTFWDLLKDSQIKEALPIPENLLTDIQYACAVIIKKILDEASIDTKYLRFSASEDFLNIYCYYLACKLMFKSKINYIVGSKFYSLEKFNKNYPDFKTAVTKNEYRIILDNPVTDLIKLSEYVIFCYKYKLDLINEDIDYLNSILKSYLRDNKYIKI